jgi:hypothetical protein
VSKPRTSEDECELALKAGFTPQPDPARGDGWCNFRNGNIVVWYCGRSWARAELVDHRYTNNRHFRTLDAAMNGSNLEECLP